MIKLNKYLALLAAILILLAAVPALANSPAPDRDRWLEVSVEDEPDDLEMTVKVKEKGTTSYLEAIPMEDGGYYFVWPSFYSNDRTLVIKTGGKEFDYEVTANMLRYGADLSFSHGEPKLTERTELMNYLPSAFACLGITLVIEGLMLFIFGYRKPRSYIVFLIANLVTQAALHTLYLTVDFGPYIKWLLLTELGIFIFEGLAYSLLFREHERSRAWAYALAANLASLILGTVLMDLIF